MNHLEMYENMAPDNTFYDLNQNPESRMRVSLVNGHLFTLATSSGRIWPLLLQWGVHVLYMWA